MTLTGGGGGKANSGYSLAGMIVFEASPWASAGSWWSLI